MKKLIVRAHKIRLKPTRQQVAYLVRACAAARHAYNWGKEQLDLEYDVNYQLYRLSVPHKNSFTHARQLKKLYNQIKPDWVRRDNGTATQEAFDDLQRAVQRYWDIQTGKVSIQSNGPRKDNRNAGWLNWRNVKKHNSFRLTNTVFRIIDKTIVYNWNIGPIKMCESLRFDGKINNCTISFDGRYWWASISVSIEVEIANVPKGLVGIDLGVKYLAVTSDGEIVNNPKAFYRYQEKRRVLQRKLDRQRRANNPDCYNIDGTVKKGKYPNNKSNRMIRTENQLKQLEAKIRGLRKNAQHQFTTSIARENGLVAIEDLNIRGMLKNNKLSKAISDASLFEIRRQLTYKVEGKGGHIEIIDRWFPSSKTCSNCGWVYAELSLSERQWDCAGCGRVNHRDGNAAINILAKAIEQLNMPPGSGVNGRS